jgi:uncharacterized caspase-like protein
MRKALVIGIDNYPNARLWSCVNDATAMKELLSQNGDRSLNFSVTYKTDVKKKGDLRGMIASLFSTNEEMALLYFSGHGFTSKTGVQLVTPDSDRNDMGVSLTDILYLANSSPSRNRVIILDCCHAGAFGTPEVSGGEAAHIFPGVTILAASRDNESAVATTTLSVFTNLLVEALKGGASDINGNITAGSVYAYVDKALGRWDQRPVFKTNVTEFSPLRTIQPKITLDILRLLTTFFPDPALPLALNPSFEESNNKRVTHLLLEPYANKTNVAVFKKLQELYSAGLVAPHGEKHMYYAAMRSKGCILTPLGQHYWQLVHKNRI